MLKAEKACAGRAGARGTSSRGWRYTYTDIHIYIYIHIYNVHISKRTLNRSDMQAIPGYKTENELVTPGSGPTGGPGDACISGQPEHRTAPGKQNIQPRRMRQSYVQPALHMKERNCAVKPSSCADFNDPLCSHTWHAIGVDTAGVHPTAQEHKR
eukprot:Tamp_16004.p1 GENE.Tamp_16004~~Tamp_16004.p1  ORF type:complete len:155 (+),score=6.34 Tamp_16004:967-1431(+)